MPPSFCYAQLENSTNCVHLNERYQWKQQTEKSIVNLYYAVN